MDGKLIGSHGKPLIIEHFLKNDKIKNTSGNIF